MGSGTGPNLNPRPLNPSDVNYEEYRLTTFRTWPPNAPISSDKLARAGFYYVGNGLEVICFSCKGRISDWQYGDTVIERHRNLFPYCLFVKNGANNVPFIRHTGDNELNRLFSISSSEISEMGIKSRVPIHPTTMQHHIYNRLPEVRRQNGELQTNARPPEFNRIDPGFYCNTPQPTSTLPNAPQPTWTSTSNRASMKHEIERVKTFENKWPLDFISPVDLARAGFFYLQISDKVQCAFCHGVLTNWERGDEPYVEHVNNFPLCPYVMGRSVGNVANGGDECGTGRRRGQNGDGHFWPHNHSGPENGEFDELLRFGVNPHKGPQHQAQASKDARMRSYLAWPQHAAVQPTELADAGFFYIGINDNTKCFYCDGGLSNWEPGDNPWVEHARWFPSCGYVLLNKGGEFIKSSLAKGRTIPQVGAVVPRDIAGTSGTATYSTQPESGPSSTLLNRPVVGGLLGGSSQLSAANQVVRTRGPQQEMAGLPNFDREVEDAMQSSLVQSFLNTNAYSPSLVRTAILRKFQSTASGVHNVDELCDFIHKVKHEFSREVKMEVSGEDEKSVESGVTKTEVPVPAGPLLQISDLSLEEENRQLREQRMCKICMDQEVGAVFIPCGHLIACVQCAPALKDCAVCRSPIRGTVRTFLS